MASRTEPGWTASGQHVCPHCAKPFARLCDLNKHAKSHSRPFKCKIRACKYHEHGWPTAKELERHINDKHSAAPRTFACLFPPCTYKSKRESNCKQHMEKSHRWKYVRSKSNGKQTTNHQHHDADSPTGSTDLHTFTNAISASTSPLVSRDQDFILYPYENEHSIGLGDDGDEDGHDIGFPAPGGQDSQVYLPWTSPTTRIRKNEDFIEMFTQTYNGAPPGKPLGNNDSLIDPALSRYTYADLSGLVAPEATGAYTTQAPIKTEPTNTATRRSSLTNSGSRKGSLSGNTRDLRRLPIIQTAALAHVPSGGERSGLPASSVACSQAVKSASKMTLTRRYMDDDQEGEGNDNPSPQKRRKSNTTENFSDTDMPDIFRFAHPRIYDRDQKEKYSPCHSSHRDISTLVRHLSRPAHRLQVTDRFISSFDVNDPEYRHPRLGLCRRCWQAFPERKDFNEHMAYVCEKVSKGKREKWRILLENLTPLIQQEATAVFEQQSSSQGLHQQTTADETEWVPQSSLGGSSPFSAEPTDGHSWPGYSAPPTRPLPRISSPGLALTPQTCAPTHNAGFVPLDEHLLLQNKHRELYQKHTALHQKHQQLIQATKALFHSDVYQESIATSGPRPADNGNTLASREAGARLLNMGTGRDLRQDVPKNNTKDTASASDQESLVLHMDSQSTDVDIQGLMHEAPEALSRQNSDLSTSSTSRSTVHHVPISPPPLPSEEEDLSDCNDNDGNDNGGSSDQPRKPKSSPSRRPPPSIPDSGYGTDPRRCSLGEQGGGGQQQQMAAVGPGNNVDSTPLSSSGLHPHHEFEFPPYPVAHHGAEGSRMDMGGGGIITLSNRARAVNATVVGPAHDHDEEDANPIAWGNPWGESSSAAAAAAATVARAAATNPTTMVHHHQHHTFADGEAEEAVRSGGAGAEPCEPPPIPNFDFYTLDFDFFASE